MTPHTMTLAALLTSTIVAGPAFAEPLSEGAVTRLDAAIESAISENRIMGTVVLVAKDGEIAYHRAAGLADLAKDREMTEDTIFRLTSVSKPIVTTAAMRLVEMGVLDLDAPVTDWLPDFTPVFEGEVPVITLRQLLTHTSGIGYAADEGGQGPYNDAGIQDGGFGTGISLEEEIHRIASVPLRFAPGDGWNYGLGIDVVGRVIERATNLPLEMAVRDLVTGPLDMNDTGFHVPAWKTDRLAANYADGDPQPALIEDNDMVPLMGMAARFEPSRATDADAWASSGAGMVGTAGDLMQLFLSLDDEDGLLDKATAQGMMSQQTATYPFIDLFMDINGGMPENGAGWTFGLGGAVLADPEKAGTPQSEGTYAWSGAYGHIWFIDPAEDLIVVSFTNTAWEGIYGSFAQDIRNAVYDAN